MLPISRLYLGHEHQIARRPTAMAGRASSQRRSQGRPPPRGSLRRRLSRARRRRNCSPARSQSRPSSQAATLKIAKADGDAPVQAYIAALPGGASSKRKRRSFEKPEAEDDFAKELCELTKDTLEERRWKKEMKRDEAPRGQDS